MTTCTPSAGRTRRGRRTESCFLNEAVKRELDARGIAIPYPQLDVHFDPQKRNT